MSSLITKRSSRRPPMEPSDGASSSSPLQVALETNTTVSSLTSPSSLYNTSSSNTTSLTSVGCPKKYADKRTMTPFQEKINALTILPSGLFCLYYLFMNKWIRPETLEWAKTTLTNGNHNMKISDCTHWNLLPKTLIPYLPPSPPPTILAICFGVLLHCPCSFLYHWQYAANPKATARLKHWSRRLDHSAIHACSIFWSYGLSAGISPGNHHLWFFAFNVLYNIDSIRCHWEEEIKPRRNQLRILGSMLLYTSPLLWQQQQYWLFGKIWAMFVSAVWFFAAYPIRGWSHAAFHIIMIGVPPLLLERVAILEANGAWCKAAATCAVVKLQQQNL